jgi:UTP--glucose-1-phosphate uridylyltransferase
VTADGKQSDGPPTHNRVVRKAIIPAAGFGTRLLPATKAVPKELFPLLGKPVIQYAVEEAVAAGITSIVIVVRGSKSAVIDHFTRDPELEGYLRSRGDERRAELLDRLASMAEITAVSQPQPRGLADAILRAREATGDESFAVLLPDALIASSQPAIGQLVPAFLAGSGCVVGVSEIETRDSERYGMIAGEAEADSPVPVIRVRSVVEKPRPDAAPSRFGIIGRYIFEADIFDFILRSQPDRHGELQISDALALYARERSVRAVVVEGEQFDSGDPIGYLRASLTYALRDPELSPVVDECFRRAARGTAR